MAAVQVAQAAISASAEGSVTKPLLGGDEEEKKLSCSQRFYQWFCSNPLQNLPIVLLFAAGAFCIIGALPLVHVSRIPGCCVSAKGNRFGALPRKGVAPS